MTMVGPPVKLSDHVMEEAKAMARGEWPPKRPAAASNGTTPESPPGLHWRDDGTGRRVPWWVARPDLAARGFEPAEVELRKGLGEPSQAEYRTTIVEPCQEYQSD